MTLVDTNILLDVWLGDPTWAAWSTERLADESRRGALGVNAIVLAEVSRDFHSLEHVHAALGGLGLAVWPFTEPAGFLAGRRFGEYRRDTRGQTRSRVLADFLIGAHAATLDQPLLTRDPTLHRRYFPELTLITPETHP